MLNTAKALKTESKITHKKNKNNGCELAKRTKGIGNVRATAAHLSQAGSGEIKDTGELYTAYRKALPVQ